MATFSLNVLGCGSAKPTPEHMPSCSVLNVRDSLYMIDCGEGAQLGLRRKGLKLNRLNHIFLTHLHGDHVFGLPGLLGTMGLMGREGHITIHTFESGIRILKEIIGYFCSDMPYEIRFNAIKAERAVIYEDVRLRIRTIPLKHRVPCVGYVFEEQPKPRHLDMAAVNFHGVPRSMYSAIKSGESFQKENGLIIPATALTKPPTPSYSYAHIGDTSYIPAIADEIGPVDLLYHESTYLTQHEADAKKRGHSTARQAAMMARDCGAKQLLLGHYSSRYKDDCLFAAEAREVFPNVIAAREGLTVNVG